MQVDIVRYKNNIEGIGKKGWKVFDEDVLFWYEYSLGDFELYYYKSLCNQQKLYMGNLFQGNENLVYFYLFQLLLLEGESEMCLEEVGGVLMLK